MYFGAKVVLKAAWKKTVGKGGWVVCDGSYSLTLFFFVKIYVYFIKKGNSYVTFTIIHTPALQKTHYVTVRRLPTGV